jgi:hypothetical protein
MQRLTMPLKVQFAEMAATRDGSSVRAGGLEPPTSMQLMKSLQKLFQQFLIKEEEEEEG